MTHIINADHTAAVSTDVYWLPIDTAPRGVKIQLINKDSEVAVYGVYYGDNFWDHWSPLPKMPRV